MLRYSLKIFARNKILLKKMFISLCLGMLFYNATILFVFSDKANEIAILLCTQMLAMQFAMLMMRAVRMDGRIDTSAILTLPFSATGKFLQMWKISLLSEQLIAPIFFIILYWILVPNFCVWHLLNIVIYYLSFTTLNTVIEPLMHRSSVCSILCKNVVGALAMSFMFAYPFAIMLFGKEALLEVLSYYANNLYITTLMSLAAGIVIVFLMRFWFGYVLRKYPFENADVVARFVKSRLY